MKETTLKWRDWDVNCVEHMGSWCKYLFLSYPRLTATSYNWHWHCQKAQRLRLTYEVKLSLIPWTLSEEMAWFRSAVNKAVEVGNKNNLTRTVRNYADSVVQHAGHAVVEGAKILQDRIVIFSTPFLFVTGSTISGIVIIFRTG